MRASSLTLNRAAFAALFLSLGGPFGAGPAASQEPLSAIDWLSNPVPVTTRVPPQDAPGSPEPPVTQSAVPPDVTVTPLDEAGVAAVGLLPRNVTGLPASLWQPC